MLEKRVDCELNLLGGPCDPAEGAVLSVIAVLVISVLMGFHVLNIKPPSTISAQWEEREPKTVAHGPAVMGVPAESAPIPCVLFRYFTLQMHLEQVLQGILSYAASVVGTGCRELLSDQSGSRMKTTFSRERTSTLR